MMNIELSEARPSSHNGACTLVIMAKAPRPGTVKTRLAQSIPVDAVTDLYRCLLNDTISLGRSLQDVNLAIMCPEADVKDLQSFTGDGVNVVAQQGKGLAAGLKSVFVRFAATEGQRVIAFNSDSPHLPASMLENAFEALANQDLVVGPTHDGGYYLVGAKAAHPELFDGDGMGTQSALDRLLTRAHLLELSVGLTGRFYDIDLESDLSRLAAELRLAPERASQTAAWLERWQQAVSARSAAEEL